MSSHRNWLRPTWYVTPMGSGLAFGSPWPDSVTAIPDDTPDPICTRCGRDCPDGGYDKPDGYLCVPCGQETYEPLSRWSRAIQTIDITLDNLYFRYAGRFGKRVVK